MALEITETLLSQQQELAKANKFVDYGKKVKETLGKGIEKEVKRRKATEDAYSESMSAYEIEQLQTDEYPAEWGTAMTEELNNQKQQFAAYANTVKNTRDKTSKEYIGAVAGMARLKASMGTMRSKIDNWKNESLTFAELAEEGAITEGMSFDERAKVFGYHNSKETTPVFEDGRFGVKYKWKDSDDNWQEDTAWEGEEPRVIEPAIAEFETLNTKYTTAVENIGNGTFNENAWVQDIRNFTNTLNFDQLRSFAGDFESVDGLKKFNDIDFVQKRQEEWLKDPNRNQDVENWWQDSANKGELKEGITRFFKDSYLTKFREWQVERESKKQYNDAWNAFAVTGDPASFNILKVKHSNDDVRRMMGTLNVPNGESGQMYASQMEMVFNGAGLVTKEGAPLRIGFIPNEQLDGRVHDVDALGYDALIDHMNKGNESGVWSDKSKGRGDYKKLTAGDSIIIYPSEVYRDSDVVQTAADRAKFAPRVITIPEGLNSAREVHGFLLSSYRDSLDNMPINDVYLDKRHGGGTNITLPTG